jgi:quercetin dioxygenase-like cupin family protein
MTSSLLAQAVQHIDNSQVCVTEWRFAPGAETGDHVHQMDYTIVPLTSGRMQLTAPDGTITHADLQPGVCYFRKAGVAHNVRNVGPEAFAFVEIELKPTPEAP